MSSSDDLLLTVEGEGRKGRTAKVGAAILAVGLTVGLLAGFFYLRGRNQKTLAARQAAERAAAAVTPPEAQVFQDEVRLEGGRALVGGTVRNISNGPLEDLSVEIELKKRAGEETEIRSVALNPQTLRPGEGGGYSLQIEPSLWRGASVVRLRSARRDREVPFKPELGARRPPEARPSPKVVVVPRPRTKGDDFINTPDNPERIP